MKEKELLAATLSLAGFMPNEVIVEALYARGLRVVDPESVVTNAERLGRALHEELCHNFRPLHSHPFHSADAVVMNLKARR